MKRFIATVLLLFTLTTNCYAGTYMFDDKASNISRWLSVKGYTGSTHDALIGYFASLSGLSQGTLYDHVATVLINLGYSGTMADMLNAFFVATTGVSGAKDAERAFWANDSYSFSSGGGFVFVDTNNFIFIDGNNFIFVN